MSEAELREIVRRATELELEGDDRERALSMGSVEQVAAQVGISPERVREAARGVMRRERPPVPELPTKRQSETVYVDRMARGELQPELHARVAREIRDHLGVVGHVSTVGDTFTWSPAAQGWTARKVVVSLTNQDGSTHVHLEEKAELAGPLFMAPALGAVLMIALTALVLTGLGLTRGDGWWTAALLPMGGLGGVMSAVGTLKLMMIRSRPQLEVLAEDLAALIEEDAARLLEPGEGTPSS